METSELKFIDTHCHLYSAEFDDDRVEMIHRAIQAGIFKMMLPNIDLISLEPMMNLVRQFPAFCFPMIGLHPCSVKQDYKENLATLRNQLESEEFAGIGETGVDLYWDTSTKDIQVEAFQEQIEWAKEFDLPVIIHSRESLDLNIDIIERMQDGRLRGIFHCFTGTIDQAKRINDVGFKIGIGGVVTFKNSNLGEILPQIPARMIVLETDAPYLAPVPNRGKRNESAYITVIAGKIAECMGLSLKQVAELTNSNAEDVFGKKA